MGDIVHEVEELAADGVRRDHAARPERQLLRPRPRRRPVPARSSPTCCARSTRSTASSASASRRRTRRTCGPRRSRRWPSARRVCEHLHLPLQSGSDRTLARMHRGYTAERYLERLAAARAAIADLAVTTDIIVGFPGETDDDFARTLEVVDAAALRRRVHVRVLAPAGHRSGRRWSTTSSPPEVVQERMQRLTEVVERHALAQARGARRARSRRCSSRARRRRTRRCGRAAPARTSSCTSRPAHATRRRATSSTSRVTDAAPHWLRGDARRRRSRPRAARAVRIPVAARCVTRTSRSSARPRRASRRSRSRSRDAARRRRDRLARLDAGVPGLDIGTAKPTPRRARRGRRTTCRRRRPVGGVVGRAHPGRGARRDRRHRGARQAGAARRRHRPLRARGRRRPRVPGRGPRRRGPSSTAATDDADGLRARVRASSSALDPVAAARIEPRQPAPHRARARGDRAHRPAVLVVRSRPRRRTAPPAFPVAHASGSGSPRDDAARRASQQRFARDARRRPGRRGARARGAAGRLSRTARAGDRLPGGARVPRAATSRRSTTRSTPPCAAPGSSPAASACGSGATRGSAGSATGRRIRATLAPRASWQPGGRACTVSDHPCSSKLHATGNDFLVQLALDARRARRSTRSSSPRSATATAASAPTGSSRSAPGRDGADCTMTLVQRRRRARRDERQRHPLPRVGRGARRARRRRATRRRHRRRPAHGRRSSATPTATWSRADVDMGAGHLRPARRSRSTRRSPFDLDAPIHGTTLPRRRGRHRQPAPRAVRRRSRRPPVVTQHGPRLEHDAALPGAPTSSSSRSTGTDRLAHAGVGAGRRARRCRAAPARARRPRSRTGAGSSATQRARSTCPAATLAVDARRRPSASAVRSSTCSTSTSTSTRCVSGRA